MTNDIKFNILAWRDKEDLARQQFYETHIHKMIECWENYLKPKYIKSLQRVLEIDESTLDYIIKYMLIVHDSGKCTEYYQQNITSPKRYRHEIVSSYLAYKLIDNVIDDRLRYLVSGAILLHHEPILMSSISYQRERGITLTDVRGRIEYPSGSNRDDSARRLHHDFKRLFEYLFKQYLSDNNEISAKIINNIANLSSEIDVNDLINMLGDIVAILSLAGDDVWRHKMRFQVSALQYILIVCDYYSSKDRSPRESEFLKEIKWEWCDL